MSDENNLNMKEGFNYFITQWFLRAAKSSGVLSKSEITIIREVIGVKDSIPASATIPGVVEEEFRKLKIDNTNSKESAFCMTPIKS